MSWIVEHIIPFKLVIFLQSLKNKLLAGSIAVEPIPDVETDFEDGIENHIQRVSFEISNTCNYTNIHPECPVSCYKKGVMLKKDVVFRTLDELASYNYNGFIAFHRYNEPMINKERLYEYIAYTNDVLPEAKIVILTNGSYLFEEDLQKLETFNIWSITVSSYTKSEHFRLKKLTTSIPYRVFYSILDDRESIYTRKPIDLDMPCFATLRDITVNCYGHISLCCYDWDNQETFGSLHEQTLKETLNSEPFMKAHNELTTGKRTFDICRRCDTCR